MTDCPSGKRPYTGARAAHQAINIIHRRQKRAQLYTYRCPFCPGWHLTSSKQTRRRRRQ